MKKALCFYLLSLVLCGSREQSLGHGKPVHAAITGNAVEAALQSSAAFVAFAELVSAEVPHDGQSGFTNIMANGSKQEDDNDLFGEGGLRSLNHFYDPFTGDGLSNVPIDDRARDFFTGEIVYVGQDSFTWASTFNCPAFNIHVLGIPAQVGKFNRWSWQNARDYELRGLTGRTSDDRKTDLANMFRSLGQVVHLLQDASQPEHVRNEQHLFPPSPIERYGGKHVDDLNYQHGVLDWRAAGFTKLSDFWDRGIYQGDSAALTAGGAS
jgi:hypothetical protein